MSEPTKKRFFQNHKKSSAIVTSILIHVAFILVAVTFVAVTTYIKPDQTFAVEEVVKRPKLKLRKLQVPVKETKKKLPTPKLRKNIVAAPKVNIDIKLPEMTGVVGGLGGTGGDGLGGIGFDFDMDLFGSNAGSDNEFVGTFYDLKQSPDGTPTEMTTEKFVDLVRQFQSSRFNVVKMRKFFKAPKLKHATAFMIPPMSADAAPKAFGVGQQVQPKLWLCHYQGKITAPETGRYRFWGLGDDVLFVRVGERLVLDACWVEHIGKLSSWKSDDPDSRKFPSDTIGKGYILKNSRLEIGDWFTLKKGENVEMQVLLGEFPGSLFSARLLIEQEGKSYRMVESDAGTRPVLPVFKTKPIAPAIIDQMKINPDIATLDGPVFGAKFAPDR